MFIGPVKYRDVAFMENLSRNNLNDVSFPAGVSVECDDGKLIINVRNISKKMRYYVYAYCFRS